MNGMLAPQIPENEKVVFDIAHAEVSGHSVLASICANPGLKEIRAKQWIAQGNPDCIAERWYPISAFLKFLTTLGPKSVYVIGREIPSFAIIPEDVVKQNLEDALIHLNISYHANHRNGEVGYYKVESYSERQRKAVVACVNPYPKSLNWGLLTGLSRQYVTDPAARAALRVMEDPERINLSEISDNGAYFIITW